jgi:2-haloacid dehalogenase
VTKPISAVVFDLGGVLIDWDPRYLYRQLFDGDDAAMERFLAEICSPEWNSLQDAGRSWAEAVETLARQHPAERELIAAFHRRWGEMLGGQIQETVDLLAELRESDMRVYALSNWSAETFPIAEARYPFLGWFEGIVISGDVGICKPDPRAFRHLIDRHRLDPATTVLVDDSEANVRAASELGMVALRFRSAGELRDELSALGAFAGAAGA